MPRKKYKENDFPPAGTIFQMPLSDGRFGVCRVLRVGSDSGEVAAIVAASHWVGDSTPSLDSKFVRETLHLTHHNWSNEPERIWVSEPPPKSFIALGLIELPEEEKNADCGSFTSWQSLPLQVLTQWKWDNDRESLEMEDSKQDEENLLLRQTQEKDRQDYLNTVTLEDLLRKDLFPRWDEYPPAEAKRGTLRIMRELIETLHHYKSTQNASLSESIQKSVEGLNQLDIVNGHFIETVERDDLYEVYEEILTAAKIPHLIDTIDQWRDW